MIGGHVHLTKIARASGTGKDDVHAVEKRLSRHLESEHRSMEPVRKNLLEWSAQYVDRHALIVADLTDVAKDYARTLQGLGQVRDAPQHELLLVLHWMRADLPPLLLLVSPPPAIAERVHLRDPAVEAHFARHPAPSLARA